MHNNKFNIFFYLLSSFAMLGILTLITKSIYFSTKEKPIFAMEALACNLDKKPCFNKTESGQSIGLTLVPTVKLPNQTRVHLEVQTKNIEANKVTVDISSINNYMMDNKPYLTPVRYDHFFGSTALPNLNTESTDLTATVYVDTAEGTIAAPFTFNSKQFC